MNIDLSQIKFLAIGSPNWLGDVVMAEPFIRTLVQNSSFKVYLLSRPHVYDLCLVLKNHLSGLEVLPYISLRTERKKYKKILTSEQTLWLNLALDPDILLFAVEYKGKYICGYPREDTSHLITCKVDDEFVNRKNHHIFNYLNLLPKLKLSCPEHVFPTLKTFPFLPSCPRLKTSRSKRLVIFNTSSCNDPIKRFPEDKFIQLGNLLIKEFSDISIVLIGLERDKKKNSYIKENIISPEKCIDTSGALACSELIGLLNISSLIISNDTGPMHIAAALGKHTIGLFGPTSPIWTSPLGKDSYYIKTKANCSPCFKKTCPLERQICFDDINEKDIISIIHKFNLL